MALLTRRGISALTVPLARPTDEWPSAVRRLWERKQPCAFYPLTVDIFSSVAETMTPLDHPFVFCGDWSATALVAAVRRLQLDPRWSATPLVVATPFTAAARGFVDLATGNRVDAWARHPRSTEEVWRAILWGIRRRIEVVGATCVYVGASRRQAATLRSNLKKSASNWRRLLIADADSLLDVTEAPFPAFLVAPDSAPEMRLGQLMMSARRGPIWCLPAANTYAFRNVCERFVEDRKDDTLAPLVLSDLWQKRLAFTTLRAVQPHLSRKIRLGDEKAVELALQLLQREGCEHLLEPVIAARAAMLRGSPRAARRHWRDALLKNPHDMGPKYWLGSPEPAEEAREVEATQPRNARGTR